jgi:histone deacetylase 4/5
MCSRFDDGSFYPAGDEGNYDHVGVGKGAGYNINIPWPHAQFGDADYLAVWEHVLMPVARKYNPDMVLISAGFDSAEGDPLGECRVTPTAYFKMTKQVIISPLLAGL